MSNLRTEVQHLIQVGYNEAFADGMESEFSRQFVALIQTHGAEALPLIDAYLIQGYQGDTYNSEIASEALLWLGLMDHPATYLDRRLIIERSLTSRSSRLRDSASNALSFLDDPASIPALQYAIAKENMRELRADMQQVLEQLKRTACGRKTPLTKWHSITDTHHLLPFNTPVLYLDVTGKVEVGTRYQDHSNRIYSRREHERGGYDNYDLFTPLERVTHWHPLPQLPADVVPITDAPALLEEVLRLQESCRRLEQENIVLKARLWEHEAVGRFE